MTSSEPLRRTAVLYLRLSDARDEASTSIVRQRADLTAEAERRGLLIVGEEVDNGISGRKERARAGTALKMLRNGDADVLLVWKFDRWSRQGIASVARLIETLDSRPLAQFIALQDNLNSDQPAWRIIASVLAEVARMEAENIRIRVSSFWRHANKVGRWPGGRVPVGYRSVQHPSGTGRALEPDPFAVEVLTDVARRIVGGESLYRATQRLNASTLKPPSASAWSVQTLRSAFTGSAIVGRVAARVPGTDRADQLFDVLRDESGEPRQIWEPALPVDLWRAVRETLLERRATYNERARSRDRTSEPRMLVGLVVCAYCGASMYPGMGGGDARYTCSSRTRAMPCIARDGGTSGPNIRADALEAWTVGRFLHVVGDLRLGLPITSQTPAVVLAEVRDSLAAVSARLGVPTIDDDEADRLVTQHRALRRRLRELEAMPTIPARVELVGSDETFGAAWRNAEHSPQGRRELLALAIDHISVTRGTPGAMRFEPTRSTIHWQAGLTERLPREELQDDPLAALARGDLPAGDVLDALRVARQDGVADQFGTRAWASYLCATLGQANLAMDRALRRKLILELAAHNMPQKSISAIAGVSSRTVFNDLRSPQ